MGAALRNGGRAARAARAPDLPGLRRPRSAEVCRPLGIEVHRPDPALLDGWTSPRRAAYRNLHGMGRPEFVRAVD
ncbi:hypothetical protein ACWIID_27855 [Streptomyces phaeochromogenes]